MAPNIPSAKITLSCPLFAADFDPRNHAFLLVAGGGGEGRSGVGNKIVLLNAFKRRELSEVVDIELSRDEDSVTSLATAQSNDTSIVAFAGINSSLAQQKQNKNRHLRSFQIDYPPRRTESKEPNRSIKNKLGKTTNLSQESLFRTVAGPKGTTDTYQRITRLSPWEDEGAARVGAITTGLAPSGEIVFFSANTTKPGVGDVIGRIRLKNGEEAEDIDITAQDEDSGMFTVAYTNGVDVFTCRISPDTRSNASPNVKCVYSSPASTGGQGPRSKFRALRFLSPTALLLLQNAPDRKGSGLVLLNLLSSPATIIRQNKLRKSVKIGLGLDVCNLGVDSVGLNQSIIAVSGSDQSLEILTTNFNPHKQHRGDAGYSPLRTYTTLYEVHPFSMTKICFSPFTPPALPVTPETPPQYVKLASVSMGNTVVVHTFALSPIPPSSRRPSYFLVRPGEHDVLTTIGSTLTALLSIAITIFLVQAFTEIRGVMPPYLGISDYLPPDIRDAIARPYNAPVFSSPSPATPLENSPQTPAEFEFEPKLQPLLRNIVRDLDPETSVLVSCNPSTNQLLVQPYTPNPKSKLPEKASEADLDSDSNLDSHQPRQWSDFSADERLDWKSQLINAGFWTPGTDEDQNEDEHESILDHVFFRNLCPQPSPSPKPSSHHNEEL